MDLCADVSELTGNAPTPGALGVLKNLHRDALKSSNAPTHAIQILQDQLAEADRDSRAAQMERQVIVDALQERQRRVADLQLRLAESEMLRSRQILELSAEIELYQPRLTEIEAERERLHATIRHLEEQLADARGRHLAAEQRCELLERQLAAIDVRAADGDWSVDKTSKILLVDSKRENILALEAILSAVGQELLPARSGEEALRILRSTSGISLVILSVEMAGMDGFEIAAHAKGSKQTRDIPIIFITAIKHSPHDNFRGYAAGAVDYISKPFDPWVLRAKVTVFVDLYMKARHLRELPEPPRKETRSPTEEATEP
ncbi:response regulator [Streptomyces sp. NPDC003444]